MIKTEKPTVIIRNKRKKKIVGGLRENPTQTKKHKHTGNKKKKTTCWVLVAVYGSKRCIKRDVVKEELAVV